MAIQIASGGADQAVSAINTTPLVDVMLVLLIIFLITIPVVNFSVPVQLPQQRHQARESQPRDVVLTVDRQGRVYWFDHALRDQAELLQRLKELAQQDPQPELHIRSDGGSDYAPVGRILLAAQRAGVLKVGFITEPAAR